jgi:hypothetical protein
MKNDLIWPIFFAGILGLIIEHFLGVEELAKFAFMLAGCSVYMVAKRDN